LQLQAVDLWKDMASHLSGDGLIHHMNLMKQSITTDYEKKLSSTTADYKKRLSTMKQSMSADYEKKLEGSKQAIAADYKKKMDSMSKKLNTAQKEMKLIKASSDKTIEAALEEIVCLLSENEGVITSIKSYLSALRTEINALRKQVSVLEVSQPGTSKVKVEGCRSQWYIQSMWLAR
jgi:hypothetical protein